MVGLCCCSRGLSLAAANGGYFLAVVHGLLIVVVSLVVDIGSRRAGFSSCGSWAVECKLSSYST